MTAAGIARRYDEYESLINHLKVVIVASRGRVVQEQPDPLFLDNLNFFTKAYLVSLCSSLEAFLQDVAFDYVNFVQQRLASAKVPNNVIRWALSVNSRNSCRKVPDILAGCRRVSRAGFGASGRATLGR